MRVEVYLLAANAVCPTRGTRRSAGYDLYSIVSSNLPVGSRVLLPLGISLRLPEGVYGRIASRSGLAFNHCIDVAGGVIDPDYTGEIKVILVNNGETDYKIQVGDRIAQIVFKNTLTSRLLPIELRFAKTVDLDQHLSNMAQADVEINGKFKR